MEKEHTHKYYADSLEDILKYVTEIGDVCKQDGILKPLWFRGHEYAHYNLEPNIDRKSVV